MRMEPRASTNSEQRVHDCNHPHEIITAPKFCEILGQGLQILALLVAGGFATAHRSTNTALAPHHERGLCVDCTRPRLLLAKGFQDGPEVGVGCQRLGPRRIPACKQKYKYVFFYCLHEGLKGGGMGGLTSGTRY